MIGMFFFEKQNLLPGKAHLLLFQFIYILFDHFDRFAPDYRVSLIYNIKRKCKILAPHDLLINNAAP